MLVECNNCESIVDAEEIGNYSRNINEINGMEVNIVDLYRLLKCPKCQDPLLVWQQSFEGEALSDSTRIFPPTEQVNPSFPKPLRSSYQEALLCFKAKAYTASAIMCRKTIEGICAEHEITSGSLKERLKKMKDKGIIENRLFEWAEALRDYGNKAAHDVNITISRQDTADIINFTNALLEYIFTLNEKFNAFKARRQVTQKT